MPTRNVDLGQLQTPADIQKLRALLLELFRLADLADTLPTQTLVAGGTIQPGARKVLVAGSGGAVTLTSNPSIEDGFDGQELFVCGTHDTNTITITDGNGVQLGAASRALGAGDTLYLRYDLRVGDWMEVAFANP